MTPVNNAPDRDEYWVDNPPDAFLISLLATGIVLGLWWGSSVWFAYNYLGGRQLIDATLGSDAPISYPLAVVVAWLFAGVCALLGLRLWFRISYGRERIFRRRSRRSSPAS